MTKAEKVSMLLAAVLVSVCVFSAFKPSSAGILTEQSADVNEIMMGGDESTADELMPGDTVKINTAP